MALDEPTTQDEVFEEQGIRFIVDKSVMARAKSIYLDVLADGRPVITPANPIKGTC